MPRIHLNRRLPSFCQNVLILSLLLSCFGAFEIRLIIDTSGNISYPFHHENIQHFRYSPLFANEQNIDIQSWTDVEIKKNQPTDVEIKKNLRLLKPSWSIALLLLYSPIGSFSYTCDFLSYRFLYFSFLWY